MNYYEHHLGDYAEATAHLSILEDGAYSRLIRKYYATEQPIPADIKVVQRLIGARTPAERQAVEAVLQEFFVLEEDGWHNARCDAEIARYLESEPERQAKRENDKERQRRSRERRKHLFEQLREVGIVARYDTETPELDRMLSRHLSRVTPVTGTRDVTDPVTRDNTVSQSPLPTPQSPVTSNHEDPDQNPTASQATPCDPPEFADLKAIYPRRAGDQGWPKALRACSARLKEGHTWPEILDGARRYAEFVRAAGNAGTEYVKQAATFCGPDKHFLQPWNPAPSKAEALQTKNIIATQEWLAGRARA